MQNEKIIENATAIGPLKQHNINMIFFICLHISYIAYISIALLSQKRGFT